MGLVNLFNILSVRPHIPYRFKAEIWPNSAGAYDDSNTNFKKYEFTVKQINQPVFKLNTENKKVFGNTAYVVPILNFGETTMEITFEETDYMDVFKLLSSYMGPTLYKSVTGALINIRVTQYDESMLTVVDKKTYICRLKEHGMPSFNNNGFGSPVEITATFNVVYVMDEPKTLESYAEGSNSPFINHEGMLPDFDSDNTDLEKAVRAEKEREEEQEKENKSQVGNGRSKEQQALVDAKKNIREQRSGELVDATSDLFEKLATDTDIMSYVTADNIRFGVENFVKQRSSAQNGGIGKSFDLSLLSDEERTQAVEEFNKLTPGEKLRYMLGVEAGDDDGLNDDEIALIQDIVDKCEGNKEITDLFDDVIFKNDEFLEAEKDYQAEANKRDLPKQSQEFSGDPIRYREGEKRNAAAGVDNLESVINAGKVTDANGNQITSPKELKSMGKYFVDGHQYKAVFYSKKWSLNSDISGNDFSYERAAANPEEVFQNVLANGPIKYNLGGKSDGYINDGLDCMGFIGIVTQATGADVVDINGNKLKYNKVKEIFASTNAANFYNYDYRVVVPPGTNMKIFVAKEGDTSGHIIVEYNGYIYESAGGTGVRKTEKSKWNDRGLKYKDVTATEEQVAQFHRSSNKKSS